MVTKERDREATERLLLKTAGEMIRREGFERLGVNALAERAGVSKMLIYRYFGSLEGLLAAYVRRHDFWINLPRELPERDELPRFLIRLFCERIEQLRADPTLRRLYRWELSADNELVAELRRQREEAGMELVRAVSRISGHSEPRVAVLAAMLTASVTYLSMLGDCCPVYNGIPLDQDRGWARISREIERQVNAFFPEL
ncbi:TetR/AcrR family transcriptional regulator [Alistipes sp.]|uniref:TetR/AcrR family transcriptional regulator n=1 Tax=Alistipes sp. TaxID=1872444 RepID=UPI003AEF33CE